MDDNARRIFDEALATLDRTASIEVVCRDHAEDALTRWARNMPKAKSSPPRSRSAMTDAEMQTFIDSRIKLALDAHDRRWENLVGAALAHERKRLAAEIDRLKSEADLKISALLAEVDKLSRGLDDRGQIVDLPSPLVRRRHDAA